MPNLAFSALVLLAVLFSVALADDLYPKCVGRELHARAVGGQKKPLAIGGQVKGSTLRILCLAFEVKSLSTHGICDIAHQTSLPFRLFVTAEGTYNDTKNPYIEEYDVRDVVGGSVNRFTITTPVPEASFSLYFQNTHSSSDCLMQIRAIFTTQVLGKGFADISPNAGMDSPNLPPAIVSLDPPTAFAAQPTTFVIKHHNDAAPKALKSIFLVPVETDCNHKPRVTLDRITEKTELNRFITRYGSLAQRFTVWRYSNPVTDNFKVCSEQENGAFEIALLTVFGGNPTYFSIISGADAEGRVYTMTPMTIQFNGYSLDTRPNRDMAKLVDEDSTCDIGEPAGGVPLATDLGPADSWGPDTTFTTWSFTIVKDGGFKVCYKRFGMDWVEVPSLADLPPGAVQLPTTKPAPIPHPTMPGSGDVCPLANPAVAPKIQQKNWQLKLTFARENVPSFFNTLITEVLCVPRSALVFSRVTRSRDGKNAVLYMDIDCSFGMRCGSVDRKLFLLEIFNASEVSNGMTLYPVQQVNAFKELGILSITVVGSSQVMATADPNQVTARKVWVVAIVCLTLIVLAALALYGFIQYRKNQHHFIQFGVDDDDDVEIVGVPRNQPQQSANEVPAPITAVMAEGVIRQAPGI